MKSSKGKFLINVNPPICDHFHFTIKRNKCIFNDNSFKAFYVNYMPIGFTVMKQKNLLVHREPVGFSAKNNKDFKVLDRCLTAS